MQCTVRDTRVVLLPQRNAGFLLLLLPVPIGLENSTVQIDLSGLRKFGDAVENGLRSGNGPFAAMYKQWAFRYRSFVQERFNKYSRGAGDWPPLKYPRRHGRGRRERASILRDTSTLFVALSPSFQSLPGQLEKQIEYGVEVGYGGEARHPSTEGKITVAELAVIHDQGLGVNPRRQIIVPPSADVIRGMAQDAERALQKAASL